MFFPTNLNMLVVMVRWKKHGIVCVVLEGVGNSVHRQCKVEKELWAILLRLWGAPYGRMELIM